MSKSIINLVEVRSDHSVIVYYESGITRPFKNMDMLPKTVRTWLDNNQAAQSVKATATVEGVQIQTAQETITEPLETSIEAVETTEPVECNFIMVNAPTEARRTAKTARNTVTQLTDEIKSWWCSSWEFRRQLVEAVTVVDC